jgi:ribosome recycling factor
MFTITSATTNKDFEKAIALEMQKPIEHFERELLKFRTGRASASMVEDVKVACYGDSVMNLRELAAISAPEARLLVIQPWDKGLIKDIEKALLSCELGVTPLNDGEIIRIQLPQMSTARREELLKSLHKKLEECRVAIRNVRKDFQALVRAAEKNHAISEDFAKLLLDVLQDGTDKSVALAEKVAKQKEDHLRID